MKKNLFIIALAVLATACNNPGNQKTSEQTTATQITDSTETAVDLFSNEWMLTELNGEAIVLDTSFHAKPNLIFDKENNSIGGNGGCNGFGGNIELKGSDSLQIADITSTQMACPNLEIEQRFFEALGNTKTYHINGNMLTLHNDKDEPVATLEQKEAERM